MKTRDDCKKLADASAVGTHCSCMDWNTSGVAIDFKFCFKLAARDRDKRRMSSLIQPMLSFTSAVGGGSCFNCAEINSLRPFCLIKINQPNCSKNQTSISSSQKVAKQMNMNTTQELLHTNWAACVASTCCCTFESSVLSSAAAARTRRILHPSSSAALLQRGNPNSTVQHFREPRN